MTNAQPIELWSSPEPDAVSLGRARVGSLFELTGSSARGRLFVYYPGFREYAWIDADGVAAAAPPTTPTPGSPGGASGPTPLHAVNLPGRTLGYNVRFWNLLLYSTLGVVIAYAMQFAGVMLVFNFLVLPAVTGLLLAHSMRGIFAIAVASGLLAALVGFSLSVPFDLPSGPAIIAVSGGIAALAWGIRAIRR